MNKEEQSKLLELKEQLMSCNIDSSNFIYVPVVPMIGIDKTYVIEEWFGVKVAKLISPSND